MSSLYDRVADRTVSIDSFDLERHEMDTSGDFTRATTEVVLRGGEADGGDETTGDDSRAVGRGEDVTYDAADHDALLAARERGGLDWDLAGEYTVDSFSAHLDGIDLFPDPPEREASRHYRRWAVESAALDLALRQGDATLAEAMGREYDPVRFVVSTRLDGGTEEERAPEEGADDPADTDGDRPTAGRVYAWLDVDPALEFKLDPTPAWSDNLLDDLAATGQVRILDFKNYYEGTDVDTEVDPDLYRRVVERFSDAVLEDAKLTDETRDALAGAEDRLSWDYPITSVRSVRELPVRPQWLNVKPSRFGTLEALLDTIEFCLDRGVSLYGGGQYELSVGREHLHALASLFYPDGPNDVAPRAYNEPKPREGVPSSPLEPPTDPAGLRWR